MDHDGLFLFLEPNSDPARDREVIEHTGGGSTLVIWAPDAESAAEAAKTAVDEHGVRLIELYRGFGLRSAARVVETVVPRAPVAKASFDPGAAVPAKITRSASIYHSDHEERIVREHGDGWTAVVGTSVERMPEVAEQLVAEGAELIEICGGTELTAAAAVHAKLGDQVPVSLVSWPFESLEGAAAFKAASLA